MRPRVSSQVVEGLLYALTAFGPFAFGGVEPWSRAGIEVLALILTLACFLKGRQAGSSAGALFWLFPAAVATLGVLQLATAAAPGGPRPLRPFSAAPYETQASVMQWAAYAALLWCAPRIIVTPDSARRYARCLFGIGLALASLGLLQAAVGGDAIYGLRPARAPFGSYYNRDHAANILLMSLGIGAGLFIPRPRRLLAGALLLVILGLVVCASQASVLAVVLAAAAVGFLGADFARSPGQRRLRAGGALGAAALAVSFTYGHVVTGYDAGGAIEGSVMGRLSIYGDAWRWWREAPLFGTGLGSFRTVYPSYQDLALAGKAAHAHSDWIEFALEAGLFGLIGAFLAAGMAGYFAARAWREARGEDTRALIGGGLAAAAAFAAHSLFDFSFQIPGNAVMFFGILGLLLSAPSWAGEVSPAAARPPPGGAALLALCGCLALTRAAIMPAAAAWRPESSVAADKAPGEGTPTDYALARASLRQALAAAERRPFDSDALYFAGVTLRRLERQDDSREFFARTAAVSFARPAPREDPGERRRRERLEALRALALNLENSR